MKKYLIVFWLLLICYSPASSLNVRNNSLHLPPCAPKLPVTSAYLRLNSFTRMDYLMADQQKNILTDTLMYDDFLDNHNNWATENSSNAYVNVANHKYVYKNLSLQRLYISKSFPVSSAEDFSYEVKLKRTKGFYKSDYWGIIYGAEDGNNLLCFLINKKNKYSVLKCKDQCLELAPDNFSEYILVENDLPNTLKVTRRGDRTFFYINDHQVQDLPSEVLPGDKFGVISDGLIEMEIESFYLLQNNSKPQEEISVLTEQKSEDKSKDTLSTEIKELSEIKAKSVGSEDLKEKDKSNLPVKLSGGIRMDLISWSTTGKYLCYPIGLYWWRNSPNRVLGLTTHTWIMNPFVEYSFARSDSGKYKSIKIGLLLDAFDHPVDMYSYIFTDFNFTKDRTINESTLFPSIGLGIQSPSLGYGGCFMRTEYLWTNMYVSFVPFAYVQGKYTPLYVEGHNYSGFFNFGIGFELRF
jgi:hypothetical protein